MIVKEEIMKFEELHQNNVEQIVGKLATLFQVSCLFWIFGSSFVMKFKHILRIYSN